MIGRLRGTLVDVDSEHCVLFVGGVGFSLGVSLSTRSQLPPLGTPDVRLFCTMRVKDDDISLYGFATIEERALFERLVAVSGVGPKGALAILSAFSPSELAGIVASGDATRLTSAKGIGKKTANRLIVDLEGPLQNDPVLKQLVGGVASSSPAARAATSQAFVEAKQALMSLGFTEREVLLAFEDATGEESLEELVGLGLKNLGGGAS